MHIERQLLAAFGTELKKFAAKPKDATKVLRNPKSGKFHVPSALAGAALLYGGHRLFEDIKMGEQQRRAMKRGY